MLSATSQHAIRALVHLSRAEVGEAVLGRDLAKLAGIPPNFLSKIMLSLRNAGIVDATRGQGGGYQLRKSAGEITLMEIARLFEGVNAMPGCFMGEKHACSDEEACTAHSGWKVVCEAYSHFMNSTTIAEIGLQSGRPRSCDPVVHHISSPGG